MPSHIVKYSWAKKLQPYIKILIKILWGDRTTWDWRPKNGSGQRRVISQHSLYLQATPRLWERGITDYFIQKWNLLLNIFSTSSWNPCLISDFVLVQDGNVIKPPICKVNLNRGLVNSIWLMKYTFVSFLSNLWL